MRFICFAIGVVNVAGEPTVELDIPTNVLFDGRSNRLVIEDKVVADNDNKGCKLQLAFDIQKQDRARFFQVARRLVPNPCSPTAPAGSEAVTKTIQATTSDIAHSRMKQLECRENPPDGTAKHPIGEFIYPASPEPAGISDLLCQTLVSIKTKIIQEASVNPVQQIESECNAAQGCFRYEADGCTLDINLGKKILEANPGLTAADEAFTEGGPKIQTCLDQVKDKLPVAGGTTYRGVLSAAAFARKRGSLECFKDTVHPESHVFIGRYIFPSANRVQQDEVTARCESFAYMAKIVHDLAKKIPIKTSTPEIDTKPAENESPEATNALGTTSRSIVKPDDHTVPSAPQPAFSRSPTIVQESSTLSMIGTQEDIFFTNFHNAAQQLSLLGIKAVGLATQIQAIRGHMMMLKLIDEHIAQLEEDNKKYTLRLNEALEQLEIVTEIKPAEKPTPDK
jgi:hypothetical protein